nr:hypothetical protein [Citrobacter freundii]UCK92202.1 hypothetical protein [Raoultella planticola]UKA77920.1 hypothetical protein [Serratia marcescens]
MAQISEFETTDPSLRGEMKITIELSDAKGGGTDLLAVHEGLPAGVAPKDNEAGWAMSLKKLADLVESSLN